MNYPWPGNVRELRSESSARWCCARRIGLNSAIYPPHCAAAAAPVKASSGPVLAQDDLTVKEAEKQLIMRALKEVQRQSHSGRQENRHEPAHLASQITRCIIWKDFELCQCPPCRN